MALTWSCPLTLYHALYLYLFSDLRKLMCISDFYSPSGLFGGKAVHVRMLLIRISHLQSSGPVFFLASDRGWINILKAQQFSRLSTWKGRLYSLSFARGLRRRALTFLFSFISFHILFNPGYVYTHCPTWCNDLTVPDPPDVEYYVHTQFSYDFWNVWVHFVFTLWTIYFVKIQHYHFSSVF